MKEDDEQKKEKECIEASGRDTRNGIKKKGGGHFLGVKEWKVVLLDQSLT